MKHLFLIFLLCIASFSYSQTCINGSFENTIATENVINPDNEEFNSLMSDCTAFGSYGNIDIITSDMYGIYGGIAQHGNWYVALTGGGTDMLSIKLNTPLTPGKRYKVFFYDRASPSFNTKPVEIGISTTPNNFGTLIYVASSPVIGTWTVRSVEFIAHSPIEYITVRLSNGTLNDWTHVDNFSVRPARIW